MQRLTSTCLKQSENVQLVSDFLTNLIQTDSHEADIRTTKLIRRLLQKQRSSDIVKWSKAE